MYADVQTYAFSRLDPARNCGAVVCVIVHCFSPAVPRYADQRRCLIPRVGGLHSKGLWRCNHEDCHKRRMMSAAG